MSNIQPRMTTCLWFNSEAEEAAEFYISIFKNSSLGQITRYTKVGFEHHGRSEGSVMTVSFTLNGQEFMGLNGGPVFKFNEAVSFIINCDTQEEIDYYWERLTADGGEGGPCGWLKDKFGVSWQINPNVLNQMMCDSDPQKAQRATQAMFTMTKFDIAALQKAFNGE